MLLQEAGAVEERRKESSGVLRGVQVVDVPDPGWLQLIRAQKQRESSALMSTFSSKEPAQHRARTSRPRSHQHLCSLSPSDQLLLLGRLGLVVPEEFLGLEV